MDKKCFTSDDLLDIEELAKKLRNCFDSILQENEHHLAISALVGFTVDSIIAQCKNLEQLISYKHMFIRLFEIAISCVDLK